MKWGKEAAAVVTKRINRPPISLAFEKVYYPWLLLGKKRYAGLYWTKPTTWDKIDCKGIETVRRDSCALVGNVMNECLRKILIDRDVEGAKNIVKKTVSDLLQDKIDLSLLVISKGLTKPSEDYANPQAHAELAKKMKKRDEATAPVLGDRVKYVVIKASKGTKSSQKAEDPLHVLKHNLPLDFDYYLENQLKKPISRIFEPIMDDTKTLFKGEHTVHRIERIPESGGAMGFAVIVPTCLSCKVKLKKGQKNVCDNCKEKEPDIYRDLLDQFNEVEKNNARYWSQCQTCQGSLHQQVICSEDDCPIFYRRMKSKKDVTELSKKLERFDLSW